MKYLILCGYLDSDKKSSNLKIHTVNEEPLVNRTIKLLKNSNVTEIFIVSDKDSYRSTNRDVKLIKLDYGNSNFVIDEFFNINEPVCYLFGDVYYSQSAIKQIVNTETTDVDLFVANDNCVCFKMIDYDRFFRSIKEVRRRFNGGYIKTASLWSIWEDLQDVPQRKKQFDNFVELNDYTFAIKSEHDLRILNSRVSDQHVMIHCVPARLNYVQNFIIPELENQFIDKISIFNDVKLSGNLTSFLDSLKVLPETGSTWHIQDDVLISPRFAKTINGTKDEIICGFSSKYDRCNDSITNPKDMWWTFPCIKIPNKIAKEFVTWCVPDNMSSSRFRDCIKENKGDDALFKEFLEKIHPDERIINLNPNIVNHVDYLLGGSVANPQRYKIVKKCLSRMWPEEEKHLLADLEKILLGWFNPGVFITQIFLQFSFLIS